MPPRTSPGTLNAGAALGAQLRLCRIAAGFTSQPALGAEIGTHETVIAKAETGDRPPTDDVFRAWMDTCGVKGPLLSALEALWTLARTREDPARYRTAPWFELEEQAHTLRYWAPLLVPGLVQTEAYARALYTAMGHDKDKVTELVAGRLARHAILSQPEAPDTTILLWEPVLRNLIGSRQDMKEQVARLLDLSWRPHVHIQVLPSSLGANAGLGGAINLAATDDAPELLLSDGMVEDVVTADPAYVRRASSTFNSVRSDALPRAESREVMTEAMESWN